MNELKAISSRDHLTRLKLAAPLIANVTEYVRPVKTGVITLQ